MRIFLDTANIESIRKYNDMGVLDGITTNPTLLSKEKGSPEEIMKTIVDMVKGPVSLEVIGTESGQMIEEARYLKKYGQNVIVKIPMIPEGLKALRTLSGEGFSTNVTLVFSANQALLAAKAGATYVSPFIGRLDDIGHNGMAIVKSIVSIFRNYQLKTQVLVASIRHPDHVVQAAEIGADVVTLPPDILGKMMKHPLTEKGLDAFLSDWKKTRNESPKLIK